LKRPQYERGRFEQGSADRTKLVLSSGELRSLGCGSHNSAREKSKVGEREGFHRIDQRNSGSLEDLRSAYAMEGNTCRKRLNPPLSNARRSARGVPNTNPVTASAFLASDTPIPRPPSKPSI
jgi:hypothetical protein